MIRTPYHKQTDMNKLPGQTINSVKTLGDYVEQVVAAEAAPPKKLSFDEWSAQSFITNRVRGMFRKDSLTMEEALRLCWQAAQENM